MKILITGGNSEIAQAIVLRRIRNHRDQLILTASSEESRQTMLKTYQDLGVEVDSLVYDFSNPEQATGALEAILQSGLDALILNAAQPTRKLRLFHELEAERFSHYLRTELEGNSWVLRKVLTDFYTKKAGNIVLISSLSTEVGTSRYSAYCAAKAALEGLIRNIAVDYGHFGIRANIVRPGVIATQRNRRFWKRSAYQERVSKLIPTGALGRPEQVAPVLDPLLDPDSYCNGAVFTVSGGLPMIRSAGVLDL